MQKVLRLHAAPPKRLVQQNIWDSRKQTKETHCYYQWVICALMPVPGCLILLYLCDQECLDDIHKRKYHLSIDESPMAAERNWYMIYLQLPTPTNKKILSLLPDPSQKFGSAFPAPIPVFSLSWKTILTPERHTSVFVLSAVKSEPVTYTHSCSWMHLVCSDRAEACQKVHVSWRLTCTFKLALHKNNDLSSHVQHPNIGEINIYSSWLY